MMCLYFPRKFILKVPTKWFFRGFDFCFCAVDIFSINWSSFCSQSAWKLATFNQSVFVNKIALSFISIVVSFFYSAAQKLNNGANSFSLSKLLSYWVSAESFYNKLNFISLLILLSLNWSQNSATDFMLSKYHTQVPDYSVF